MTSSARKPVPAHRERNLLIAGAAAIILLTLVAYIPAMRAGFIWDDNDYLTENPLITDPGGLAKIWFSAEQTSQYFPLVYTMFRMEYALWGMSPIGYHTVNVLLHIANALLIWLILRRLPIRGAWLAAAIFALHPVQVESVAWITERKNTLSTLFYLLAILASFRFMYSERGWRRYYALGFVAYALALFAKTTACTLSAAVLIVHWLRGKRIGTREIVRIIPFLAAGIAMGLLSVWWEHSRQGTFGAEFDLSYPDRLIIAGRALIFYLAKLVVPIKLAFSYPRWSVDSASPAQYAWPAACILIACVLVALRKQYKGALVAAVFFAATLSPILGFINLYTFRYTFVADHYQYVACIGPIALFAWLITRTWANRSLDIAVRHVIPCLILAILGVLTWRQANVYTSSETIWRDTVAKNPTSWLAQNNLGNLLCNRGDTDQGLPHYYKAVELNPDFAEGNLNIGIVLVEQGRCAEAIEQYESALAIVPTWADAHYDMGVALAKMHRRDDAIAEYRKAIEITPDYPDARNNLGVLLIDRGQLREAALEFAKVLELHPDNGGAHRNLAVAFFCAGRYDDAWREARQASQCGMEPDPSFIEALSRKSAPPQE